VAALTGAFALITGDVFNAASPHVLLPADVAIHTAVSTTLSYEFRTTIADQLISNTPIEAGSLAIVAALAALCVQSPRKGLPLTGVVFAMNVAGKG